MSFRAINEKYLEPGAQFLMILGIVALCQIQHLSRPVVHLSIDIDSILAVPGRIGFVVPYPLEIGRIGSLTA